MLSRIEGDDWIVVSAQDRGYGVKRGDVFGWTDSFCVRMVAGLGPHVAPDSASVPGYAEAMALAPVPIGAYIGIPIAKPGGGLFGTLCAIDPEPQEPTLGDELPIFQMIGGLIGRLVAWEMEAQNRARMQQADGLHDHVDELTQLKNAEAWKQCLLREEERAARLACPTGVILFDLEDSVSDGALDKFGQTLASCVLEQGCAFRIGHSEFAVMMPETDPMRVREVLLRVRLASQLCGIGVYAGAAMRDPRRTLICACEQAGVELYNDKMRRTALYPA